MTTNEKLYPDTGLFTWNPIEKTRDWILIFIPVAVLLILTLPHLSSAYWEDEIVSVNISRQSWSGMFRIFRAHENNMSLYFIALFVWIKCFGESEISTHALSLFFGVLAIFFFFRLARIWFTKTTALAACLLLAANPLFAFYAVESRSYSPLVLSAILSTLLFVRLMRKPGYRTALGYGFCVAAGVYVHYFGILIVLVHGLAFNWRKLTRAHVLAFGCSALTVGAAILPLFLFPPQDKGQVNWMTRPELKLLGFAQKDLFGGALMISILLICLFFFLKKGYRNAVAEDGYFLPKLSLAWSFVPTLLLFSFSYFVKPLFLTRYFTWCLPGAVLLCCLVVSNLKENAIRKSVVYILLLILLCVRSMGILSTKGSGYKEAAEYVNENIRPHESILTYPYSKSYHMAYYLDRLPSRKSYAIPTPITQPPVPGGGGPDSDPDMQMLEKMIQDQKIYLICPAGPAYPKTDSVLNRTWLPAIQKIIRTRHPQQQVKIFGSNSQQPIQVIVYE